MSENNDSIPTSFVYWILNSPGTLLLWCFSISFAVGQNFIKNWYVSGESVLFFGILFVLIITVPAFLASIFEFRNKIPRDRSAIPNNRQARFQLYRIIVVFVLVSLITVELLVFLAMLQINIPDDQKITKDGYEFWKDVTEITEKIIPFYIFGMLIIIKRWSFLSQPQ